MSFNGCGLFDLAVIKMLKLKHSTTCEGRRGGVDLTATSSRKHSLQWNTQHPFTTVGREIALPLQARAKCAQICCFNSTANINSGLNVCYSCLNCIGMRSLGHSNIDNAVNYIKR